MLQPITDFRLEMHQFGRHCAVLLAGHDPKYSNSVKSHTHGKSKYSIKAGRGLPLLIYINHKGGRA